MPAERNRPTPNAIHYRIRIEEHLGEVRADWFEDMTITAEANVTVLTGPVVDQAALHGLLKRVRDLGLELISVERISPTEDFKGDPS